MTRSPDEELLVHLREVERLFGQCLLRLQAYERGLKAVLAHHDISWSAQTLDKKQAVRGADIRVKTLGAVVNNLLESFLTTDDKTWPAIAMTDSADDGSEGSIRVRIRLGFSEDDLARIENGLRELVSLRNNLVHHFFEQHDLESLDGCRTAQDALLAASDRIKPHNDELRQWLEDLEATRLHAAEVIKSGAIHDLIVDGTIPWPVTAIVAALREAAAELAADGWVPVAKAAEWISTRYPEELPTNYRCRSWRQVVHESRCFELRYRQTDQQRAAWYRVRRHDLSAERP